MPRLAADVHVLVVRQEIIEGVTHKPLLTDKRTWPLFNTHPARSGYGRFTKYPPRELLARSTAYFTMISHGEILFAPDFANTKTPVHEHSTEVQRDREQPYRAAVGSLALGVYLTLDTQ